MILPRLFSPGGLLYLIAVPTEETFMTGWHYWDVRM